MSEEEAMKPIIIIGKGMAGTGHYYELEARRGQEFEGLDWWDIQDGTPRPEPQNYSLAVIATPSATHLEAARPWIEAGIPVLIEKPLCLSLRALEQFQRYADQGAWIGVAQNSRFVPAVAALHRAIAQYAVLQVHSWKTRQRSPSYYQDDWHGRMATDGGVLSQQAEHALDLVCHMFGEAPGMVAAFGRRLFHQIEGEDTAAVILDFPTGLGMVGGTTAAGRNSSAGIHLVTAGGAGTAEGGTFGNITNWNFYTEKRPEQVSLHNNTHLNMHNAVLDALSNGGPPPCTVASGGITVKAMQAAYLSMARHGRPVKFGEEFEPLGRAEWGAA